MRPSVLWLNNMKTWLKEPLLKLGDWSIALWDILTFFILLALILFIAGKVRSWLVNHLLLKTKLDHGGRHAVGTITRYVIIFVGSLVILQTMKINLTTFNVIAGTLGIGIGFGLQNVASNFISGLIILLERPIKIGDRIEVGKIEGDVIEIGARSTTVVTNDNIAIIVPNSKFITENVVNWMYTGARVRFRIPICVAYGSDVRLVEKLLLEVARENPDVLNDPPPVVRFLEFGDNGMLFELRPWSTSLVHRKGKLISSINFVIHDKFKEHHIETPFPQRVIHIRRDANESF